MAQSYVRPGNVWLSGKLLAVSLIVSGYSIEGAGAVEPHPQVQPLISSGKTIVGETIVFPEQVPAKITAVIVTMQPGERTGWHRHGIPVFGYMLEGELTVDYGPHGKHVYRKGDSVLEAIKAPHNGTNTGTGIMRILAVFMGADGLPLSEPATK